MMRYHCQGAHLNRGTERCIPSVGCTSTRRWDQFCLVAELARLPAPVVSARAGLHRHHAVQFSRPGSPEPLSWSASFVPRPLHQPPHPASENRDSPDRSQWYRPCPGIPPPSGGPARHQPGTMCCRRVWVPSQALPAPTPRSSSAMSARWITNRPVHAARHHRAPPQVCPFRHVRHRQCDRQWRPVG